MRAFVDLNVYFNMINVKLQLEIISNLTRMKLARDKCAYIITDKKILYTSHNKHTGAVCIYCLSLIMKITIASKSNAILYLWVCG